jgi:hypothetical protein
VGAGREAASNVGKRSCFRLAGSQEFKMITRRRFIQTSMAASAVALTGCGDSPKPPAPLVADAELQLYFVGGSVFVKDANYITALQLSGKGQSYNGHSLEHASYVAGPPKLFPGGVPLPGLAVMAPHGFSGFNAICVVGKKVTVTGKKAGAKIKCQKLANYGHIAHGKWVRKGTWDPTMNPAINSMFTLNDGDLGDEKAVNQNGEKVKWWVKEKGKEKDLSDVAVLELKAPVITISGLTGSDIVVSPGDTLKLSVFSGPLEMHGPNYKYKRISHALLLKTIYDVNGSSDDDIMPTTDKDIDGMEGETMDNPCTPKLKIRVPPDSEYCPNYDELP